MRPIPGLVQLGDGLQAFLAANAHAFSRADILEHWTRTSLEHEVADGNASRILPGVYCGAVHQASALVRGEALNLWHPAGLVTGPLALRLYSDALPTPRLADIRVIDGFRPRVPAWVRCRQGRPMRAHSLPHGVACTAPERALLDAWRFSPSGDRRNLLYEALWARVCTWQGLARELDRSPRVSGRRDLERVLGWFAEGATTPLEVRAKHETFADARFREFEWQVELRLGPRRPAVDMLHRAAMVVVELDGDRYHSTRQARNDDRDRQNDLTTAGYVTIRLGWEDVARHPERSRQRVLTVVAGRLARPGGT
ncbi:endonuclease domain-containing protein [Demequina sp. SO4-13]|uniref:endonuclease domain-containing protein n=1 Tax=Demequina sp. SO4-13 TaxID=3401027 RepID=UPI003AF7E9F5